MDWRFAIEVVSPIFLAGVFAGATKMQTKHLSERIDALRDDFRRHSDVSHPRLEQEQSSLRERVAKVEAVREFNGACREEDA